jgi:DnaB-like helicase C terminal domain
LNKYGYGGKEETLYLQAYNLAKEGHPTLLFSFESDKTKLYKIFISHLLKIEIENLNYSSDEIFNQIKEAQSLFNVPLSFLDESSLPLEEIGKLIQNNKVKKGITHVVLDRVDDTSKINQLALKLGVQVFY